MYERTRFLIIRLSSIGDVLHATTVAHNLKEKYPLCHITWIVSSMSSELLQYNPDIDELFIWSREKFEAALYSGHWRIVKASIKKLCIFFAQHTFDIALDIHGLLMTGIITRMSHAKRRIGMYHARECNRFFMQERGPKVSSPHKIHHYMSVLAALDSKSSPHYDYDLILKLPLTLNDFALQFFAANGIDTSRKILMVNPYTSWPDKNWGIDKFAVCLSHFPTEIQIILCGAPGDCNAIADIIARLNRPALSIAGKTTLLELAALFQHADLLLSGDTGPLHIAAAVGLRTISLWGPTRPEMYGPLVGDHVFICSDNICVNCCKTKCHLHTNACMSTIDPAVVAKKTLELLDK